MAHGAAHASSDSLCRFDRPGAPLRALYPPSCVDEGLARSKGVGEHVPARHHLPHPHVQRVEGGGALVECVNERLPQRASCWESRKCILEGGGGGLGTGTDAI